MAKESVNNKVWTDVYLKLVGALKRSFNVIPFFIEEKKNITRNVSAEIFATVCVFKLTFS